MKVFISWSGKKSYTVANALREWLPNVVNAAEPFLSEIDIEKGSIGLDEIGKQLNDSFFGIVCLTQENEARPWVNYEAGALSKTVADQKARVATLLVDLATTNEINGPMKQFQATKLSDREDFKRLMWNVENATGGVRSKEKIGQVVDGLWSQFEALLGKPLADLTTPDNTTAPTPPAPDPTELVEEVLSVVREINRKMTSKPSPQSGTIQATTSIPTPSVGMGSMTLGGSPGVAAGPSEEELLKMSVRLLEAMARHEVNHTLTELDIDTAAMEVMQIIQKTIIIRILQPGIDETVQDKVRADLLNRFIDPEMQVAFVPRHQSKGQFGVL